MKINPYLGFDGQCGEAFKFYEQALGGKIVFSMTWGESPNVAEFPADTHSRIMHTTLAIEDQMLMGADVPPGQFERAKGICISLHLKDIVKGERIFNSLSEGGTVQMPFQQTFWAVRFGMCRDRFGIPWMVNCEGEATQ